MTVRDLIQQDICVDVVDNVTEELDIAFCGPLRLTAEGEKEFSDVMDYTIKLTYSGDDPFIAFVDIDQDDDGAWETRLERAKLFFESAAGFCSCSDYDRWFITD